MRIGVRWPHDHDLVDDAFPACKLSGDRLAARLVVMEHRDRLLQNRASGEEIPGRRGSGRLLPRCYQYVRYQADPGTLGLMPDPHCSVGLDRPGSPWIQGEWNF